MAQMIRHASSKVKRGSRGGIPLPVPKPMFTRKFD
jgi:hypothetical protein